jgi:lysozyme
VKSFKKWLKQMINQYQVSSRSETSNSNIATAYDETEVEAIVPMQISHAGMRFIMEFEDLRLKSYDDGAGTGLLDMEQRFIQME